MSISSRIDTDIGHLKGRRPLAVLDTMLQKGNIPHALLFIGREGVGKRAAAFAFARACNCQAMAKPVNPSLLNGGLTGLADCECRSCRKIRSGNHPDFFCIEPSGAFIKIGDIRMLLHSVSMKPYEAKRRVILISQAETMNPEAANALLKMLEEPPDKTLFILTAAQRSLLLPTIFSRCQSVRFTPVAKEWISSILAENRDLDEEGIAAMTALADGSLSKIWPRKPGMNCRDWVAWRRELLGMFGKLTDPLAAPPADGVVLAFAEKLFKKKGLLADSLDVLQSWIRDLIVCRYSPDRVINQDLITIIHRISSQISVGILLEKCSAIHSARKKIRDNANARLVLEILMLRLTAR